MISSISVLSGIGILIFLLAVATFFATLAAVRKADSTVVRSFYALLAVFFLGVFFVATGQFTAVVFGYGHVQGGITSYSDQLDSGVPYENKGSDEIAGGYVILVRKLGTSEFRTIHVKEMSPKIFTLVDGKPVAILTTPSEFASFYGAPSTSK